MKKRNHGEEKPWVCEPGCSIKFSHFMIHISGKYDLTDLMKVFFLFHSNPHVFHLTNFMISSVYIYISSFKNFNMMAIFLKNLLFEIEISF